MWYALIFMSFMGVQGLTVDLNNEYSSFRKCKEATQEAATELKIAMLEELRTSGIIITDPPEVFFNCTKIPIRKS